MLKATAQALLIVGSIPPLLSQQPWAALAGIGAFVTAMVWLCWRSSSFRRYATAFFAAVLMGDIGAALSMSHHSWEWPTAVLFALITFAVFVFLIPRPRRA